MTTADTIHAAIAADLTKWLKRKKFQWAESEIAQMATKIGANLIEWGDDEYELRGGTFKISAKTHALISGYVGTADRSEKMTEYIRATHVDTEPVAQAQVAWRKSPDHGGWVLYGPADVIVDDRPVIVTKKDGTQKEEWVSKVVARFDVEGLAMAYGTVEPPKRTYRPRRMCEECGENPGTVLVKDESGALGYVCRLCDDGTPLAFI